MHQLDLSILYVPATLAFLACLAHPAFHADQLDLVLPSTLEFLLRHLSQVFLYDPLDPEVRQVLAGHGLPVDPYFPDIQWVQASHTCLENPEGPLVRLQLACR